MVPSTGPPSEAGSAYFRLDTVPEPSTGLLVIAGLLGLAGWRRVRGYSYGVCGAACGASAG